MEALVEANLSIHVQDGGVLVHTRAPGGYGLWLKVDTPADLLNGLKARDTRALALVRQKVNEAVAAQQRESDPKLAHIG